MCPPTHLSAVDGKTPKGGVGFIYTIVVIDTYLVSLGKFRFPLK